MLANGKPVKSAKDVVEEAPPRTGGAFRPRDLRPDSTDTPAVKWEVRSTANEKVGDTAVVVRKLIGHVDNSSYPAITVDIDLTLTTPAGARGVPVIIEFFPVEWAARIPPQPRPTWQEQVIARGWAYAILSPSSIQADNGAGLTKGIIGLVNKGQPRKPDDWGALEAWAWGASRALDYLETNPDVDARRAVHRRRVALRQGRRWSRMAYEPRFAIGFIGSSGAGGAALARRNWGEKLENVAGQRRIPLDGGQLHQVRRGSAEREGSAGRCARVDRAVRAAPGVHRRRHARAGRWLGGSEGHVHGGRRRGSRVSACWGSAISAPAEFPPVETSLIAGELAYRQHAGGHTSGPNWPTFLDFAARYFSRDA